MAYTVEIHHIQALTLLKVMLQTVTNLLDD